jgi:hypothetical protein
MLASPTVPRDQGPINLIERCLMLKLNVRFRTLLYQALAAGSVLILGNTVRLYAEREINALGFLFAAFWSVFATLVFASLSLDGRGDRVPSILTVPESEPKAEDRPASSDFLRRWFNGLGDAA